MINAILISSPFRRVLRWLAKVRAREGAINYSIISEHICLKESTRAEKSEILRYGIFGRVKHCGFARTATMRN